MTDYTELVKFLRGLSPWAFPDASKKRMNDAADAIEELQDKVVELEEELNDADVAADDNGRQIEELQAEVQILKVSGREAYFEGLAADAEPKREEVWKDVIGYEGLYQVSDQARVRNNKGKILKQSVKVGKCVYYKYVKLYKDGQYRQGYVHRMMAECFIPNPDNLPIINHKDEDGTNNRLDNLEWCTVEYNSNYGNAKRNMSRGKRRRAKMDGPIVTPCRGCSDYDGYGGCKSKGGCARAKLEVQDG